MGIRIAADQTWRHVKSGKQDLSKTRLILMQFHRPMMLKLVMVGKFPSKKKRFLSALLQVADFFCTSAKGGAKWNTKSCKN